MSTSRRMNQICVAAVILSLVLTILFMNGSTLGIVSTGRNMGYENRLFDPSIVHTVDIVMDDWDAFMETCENEEYSPCAVVIDGESYKNVAIRAKGNTSLSSVRALGSQRYSFKLEFDQYETGKTYHGLDKLSLNNLIQDNTMMKDYLVYRMMDDFEVDTPLCSYVYITVNGEDWGLYLAVEGVEESFLERNYGSKTGELYKPDSLSFGGGRGNGRDFDFDNFNFDNDNMEFPEVLPPFSGNGETSESSNSLGSDSVGGFLESPDNFNGGFDGGFSGFGGMGSADVKLQYIDDDLDSYHNIFDNAKTDITDADKQRLIGALKNLSSYTDLESTVDTDEVLRYFVVHNFVCNGDSYTGAMIHNYYLHEQNGCLSMIPWDYNLAFGTFQESDAASSVNASIDNPVSGGSVDGRPMLGWIFSDENYTQKYHALFSEFIDCWFSDGQLEQMIEDTQALLRSYVESDPTKFCTTDEFEAGVQTLEQFVTLRAEAISHQLAGDTSAVDTAGLDISKMGSMGNTMDEFGNSDQRNDAADPRFMPWNILQSDGSDTMTPENASENNTGTNDPPTVNQEGEQTAEDRQNHDSQPGAKENGDGIIDGFAALPPNVGFSGGTDETDIYSGNGENSIWILLGASVLFLFAGLFIAIKTKH